MTYARTRRIRGRLHFNTLYLLHTPDVLQHTAYCILYVLPTSKYNKALPVYSVPTVNPFNMTLER